jgi:Flp pilus assembly pilin Flp
MRTDSENDTCEALDPLSSDTGQTTVEYALITSLVIAMTIVVFAVLQASILPFFTNITGQLAGVAAGL